jgi:hypothetical protein
MWMARRDLFIEMHFGPKRYVDPEPFANSLLLDHAIQQVGTLKQQLASRLQQPRWRWRRLCFVSCYLGEIRV